MGENSGETGRFTGFTLTDTTYNALEEQVSQMCVQASFLNLTEILPDCFKSVEQTHELLTMLEKDCRLMEDEAHLCSVQFLNKCLELF